MEWLRVRDRESLRVPRTREQFWHSKRGAVLLAINPSSGQKRTALARGDASWRSVCVWEKHSLLARNAIAWRCSGAMRR
jgi:hypothetical protein